jgi:hypothetical protein
MPTKINNEKTRKSCIIKIKPNLQNLGANMLIGATSVLLGDCFWGIFLDYFRKKFSKNISKYFKISLYYFVKVCVKTLPKICQKYVIFKVFQVHLLLKDRGYKLFYTTFEGLNVNEIISYFGHS